MESFTDANGNKHHLRIDLNTIRRVAKQTGFEFGTCLQNDGESYFGMLEDLEMLPRVLFYVAEPDCELSAFENAIHGDVFDDAREALTNAFAFFCPKSSRIHLTNWIDYQKLSEEHMMAVRLAIETITKNASESVDSSDLTPDLTASTNSSTSTSMSQPSDGITQPELSKS